MFDSDDSSVSDTIKKNAMKKRKYSQVYKIAWEEESKFKGWLQKSKKGQNFAYCSACHVDIDIESGKLQVERHASGKKHAENCKTVAEEPEFTDVIQNITVAAGRNVRFACAVKNLGTYKVAWMHFEQSAILTVHNHVITRNPRISVTHDKHRTWFLHINNVQEEDKGRYMCQINTVTAKTRFGFLHVVVPPNIDDSLSSSDAIVREGSNETLTCKATGFPTPSVKWKRDDNTKITINKTLQVSEWEGETLELTKISRLDMGAYLCIASNGVPPTVSKRIKVSVDYFDGTGLSNENENVAVTSLALLPE
ncbi:unnamed protein product [Diabrotica balteata]|uniref:Ig-like domain-containing protein n=1 Tax=Diabrotica balteata TaxID=107213 RepID=A0A9N9SPR1_DIABA|nr:unnamed protein product [Diabrotica balteata]